MRHRFHSLCPYFAMFPESFAERWIAELTSPGEVVLDPFCGRGTAPFQALLMDRVAFATDTNPVAYCVTKAKTSAPRAQDVKARITNLAWAFDSEADEWESARHTLPPFFRKAFAPSTLRQILFLREKLRWTSSRVDCMIAALALGSLHGESDRSSSYFSNQMPRTISTKPEYSMRFWNDRNMKAPKRDAFEILYDRVDFRYVTAPPVGESEVWNSDMRLLPRLMSETNIPQADCIITSPPYLDVTDFEEDQWLRLWFLGGSEVPRSKQYSNDDRHSNRDLYWGFIGDAWRVIGQIVAPDRHVVLRVGARHETSRQLADALLGASALSRRKVKLVHVETSKIKRRQTDSFRPGSTGCRIEVDCVFQLR